MSQLMSELNSTPVAPINGRIRAARLAIAAGGGPTQLARTLSEYLGVEIKAKRIEAWRARGVPDEWTTIVEHHTGMARERLNPHLYDVQVSHKVIHNKLTGKTPDASIA